MSMAQSVHKKGANPIFLHEVVKISFLFPLVYLD